MHKFESLATPNATMVHTAAAYLDLRLPDWWEYINRQTLDLSRGRHCIGGQLASNHPRWMGLGYRYDEVLNELDIDEVSLVWCSNYQGIKEAWVKAITARVDARDNDDMVMPPSEPESTRVTILAGNSVYEIDRSFDGLMHLLSHLDVDLKEREVTRL